MNTQRVNINGFARKIFAAACAWALGAATANAAVALSGAGTEASPYLITSLADLATFRDWVNAGNDCAGEFYQLTADIDMGGVAWTPIGSTANPFSGVFDGSNHILSGLKLVGPVSDTQLGLFGVVSGTANSSYTTKADVWVDGAFVEGNIVEAKYTAVIKNVALANVDVSNTSSSGSTRYTGALAGMTKNAYIAKVTVSGSVSGIKGVGGLVGSFDGSVAKECVNSAAVTAGTDGYNAGGIAGGANYGNALVASAFIDCSNSGKITTTAAGGYAGGIVGMAQGGTGKCDMIQGCSNSGEIHSVGVSSGIGGIVGQGIALKVISSCMNTGILTADASVACAGGIAGTAISEVYGSANQANITIAADYLCGIYTYDRSNAGVGGLINGCVNEGTLVNTSTNPSAQTHQLAANSYAAVYSNQVYADVAAVNAVIAASEGQNSIEFQNCTVTDKSGTLVLNSGLNSIVSDTQLCIAVDVATGNASSLTVSIPGVSVTVAANNAGSLNILGANNTVKVNEGATVASLFASGNGSTVTNDGTVTSLSLGGSGSVVAVNNGTLGTLGFGGVGIYTVDNNGTISHTQRDSNPTANEHTCSTIQAGTITLNNRGTIEAIPNVNGIGSYALLFYNGATVVVNAYNGSVVRSAGGYFIACGSADSVTLNIENGAKFYSAGTEFVPTSSGKLVVQAMAPPVTYVAQIGETKYASINAAFAAVNGQAGESVEIKILADVTEELTDDYILNKSVTLATDVEGGVTVNLGFEYGRGLWAIAHNGSGKLAIEDDVTITNLGQLFAGMGAGGVVDIKGDVTAQQLWAYYGGVVNIMPTAKVVTGYGDGMVKFRYDSTINVTGNGQSEVQFAAGYFSADYSGAMALNLTNTYVTSAWLQSGATSGSFTLNLDNAKLVLNGALNLGANATGTINMTIDSIIIAKSISNVDVINIDATGLANAVKVIDYTGSGTMTLAQYGTVNVTGGEAYVESNDLWVREIVVAKIGVQSYASLQDAVDAVVSGQTITLYADNLAATLAASQSVTIDANGHSGLSITTVAGYEVVYDAGTYSSVNLTPWDGAGTVADPFLIATEADLIELQTQVAKRPSYCVSNFLQVADITLTAWSGIGTSESVSFQGVYDGGNKTINVQFDNGKYRGVFRYAKNATIKNLKVHVTGFTSIGTSTGGAAFVGESYGSTLQNLTATCAPGAMGTAEAPLTHNGAGIVVRMNGGTCYACTNKMDIHTSYTKVGGIAAFGQSSNTDYFELCSNEGALHRSYTSTVDGGCAGIIGWQGYTDYQPVNIKNCSSTGAITATKTSDIGSFVGAKSNGGLTVSGINVGLADFRPVGVGEHTTPLLWFATVNTAATPNTATFNGYALNASNKVMEANSAAITLANEGDYIILDTSLAAYSGTVSRSDAGAVTTTVLSDTVTRYEWALPTYTVNVAAGAGVENLQYKLGAAGEWTAYTASLANVAKGTVLGVKGTTSAAGYEVTNVTVTVLADYPSENPLTINKSLIQYFPTSGTTGAYPGQDGSAENPFVLATADDYVALKNAVANGTAGTSFYRQVADITLGSAETPWTGIGLNHIQNNWTETGTYGFSGTLAGGNHTVNVYMGGGRYHGLFNNAVDAAISNLTVNVTGWAATGVADDGGALCGICTRSTLQNIKTTASGTISTDGNLGGVAGLSRASTFIACSNEIDLTTTFWHVGGIVSYTDGLVATTIRNCMNAGNLTSDRQSVYTGNPSSIGGILGWANGAATIDSCVNTGTLTTGSYWGNPTTTKFGYGSIIGTWDQRVTTVTGVNVGQDNVAGCLHDVATLQWALPDTPSAGLVTFCTPETAVAGTVAYKAMYSNAKAFTLTAPNASLTIITNFAVYTGTVSLDASLANSYYKLAVGGDSTKVVYTAVYTPVVWVDRTYTPVNSGGHVLGFDAFTNIQDALTVVPEGGTLNIAAGTYTNNVYVDKSLDIVGAGAASTIVDGNDAESVFIVDGDIDVSITGLTIQNGSAPDGGGIYVQSGTNYLSFLAVTNCVFKNNVATTGNGGALANLGLYEAVVLEGCTFSSNTAFNGQGGAVSIIDGDLAMANCTVSGNTAKNGGGLAFNSGAGIDFDHITVTLNEAKGSTSSKGGGLYPNGASGTVSNSIFCGNTDDFTGIYLGLTTDNVNGLIPGGGSNNLRDLDAMLGALAENGGPTPTHKLLPGSPAINGGATSDVTVDQRGVPRAQGNAPDIGALETVYIAYVDDNYTSASCGGHVWGQDSFATLATAIAAVADSGTIRVAAGTYAGGQTINGSLTFEGANKDVAGYGTRGPESVITTTIYVKGQNNTVAFNGFKFTASNYALLHGAAPSTTDWVFKNNLVAGGSGCACYNEGTSNWRDITVVSNKFTVVGSSSALRLANVRHLSVRDNQFSGGFNALQLVGASGDVLVDGNEISNTTNEALKFGGPIQNGVCSNNTISNANTSGEIDVGAIRIRGVALPYNLTVVNNTLIDSFNGVAVKDGESLVGATILVTQNNFDNNSNAGVYNGGTGMLNAQSNYWGDATGPVGAGDDVVGTVDYTPYFTEAAHSNFAPRDIILSAATVVENAGVVTIGTLNTTDDDAGSTFTYALVAGTGDTGNNFFTIDGTTLKTSASLNFETQPTLSVRIRTTDNHVDNAGMYDKVFMITVTDVEETPVLDQVDNQPVEEDVELTFTATASDSDGDPLTFTWTGVPTGATATDTGVFTWTPSQAQIGQHALTVTVSDGTGLSDSQNFTITVTAVNDAPTVAAALPNLTNQQDFASFDLALGPVFTDPDSTLTYSVEVTGGLVNAVVADSTLTLSSQAGARGTAAVTVTATDGLLSVTDSFDVTLKPVWNTTRNTFFDTIQAAIDASTTVAGDTISVAAGIYAENLTITKRLTLSGAGDEVGGTLLQATGNAITINGSASGVSAAQQLSIRDIHVKTSGDYGVNFGDGVQYARIEDCTIETQHKVGFKVATAADIAHLQFVGLDFVGNSQDVAIYTTAASQTMADDIHFERCSFSGSQKGFYAEKLSNSSIKECTFTNVGADPAYASGAAIDINLKHGDFANILIEDCTFTGCGSGSKEGMAIGIKARGTGTDGYTSPPATLTGMVIRDCTITGCERGIRIGEPGKSNTGPTDVTIVNNAFDDNIHTYAGSDSSAYGDVVNATTSAQTANGNYWGEAAPNMAEHVAGDVTVENYYAVYDAVTGILSDLRYLAVYVDDDFTEATAGWGLNRFATIQGGVTAVSPYGTVNVAEGTYNERVTVPKTLTLAGAGAATTTINGGNSGMVVKITANDVEMYGFTVTGSGSTPITDAGVILHGVTGCEVRDCLVNNNGGVGIGLQGANCNTVQDNTLTNNVIAGIGLLGSTNNIVVGNTVTLTKMFGPKYGYGIVLDGVDLNADDREDIFSTGNTISGNTFADNQGDGVYLGWACNGNTIAGNTLSGNGNNGLYIWKADGNTVQDNIVSGNLAEGVQLMASANNVILGNVISGSATSLWIRSGWTQFEPHTAGHEDLASGNTILTNSFLASVAGVALEDNTEYTLDDAGLVDVSANYWGAAFGPSGEGFFGTGSAVVGAIDIESYFVDTPLATLHYFDLYVDVNGIEDVNHFKTIQAAYAAANPGDTIHVADGGYTLGSTFTVAKQGLTITGTSSAAVSIDASARTGTAYGIHVAASDVTLEHFTLIPASYAGAGFPIHVSGTPAILSNITLRDIVVADSYRTPFDFNGVDNLVLDGLVATGADYGTGIGLTGCVGVTLTGCQTAGNAWGGVRVSGSKDVDPDRASGTVNVNFASNTFAEVNALYIENDGLNSTVAATGYSYKIVTSAGTTTYLEQGYTEAQAIAVALQAEAAFPGLKVTGLFEADGDKIDFVGEMSTAVVYVDDNWAGTSDGTGVQKPGAAGTYLQFGRNAFATVQAGVAGVDAGGTVNVLAGDYTANTLIAKAVTLLGPNANINPNTAERNPEAVLRGTTSSGLSDRIETDSTNIVFNGFTFSNLRIDNYYGQQGTGTLLISGVAVRDNIFTNVFGTPVYLRDGRDATESYSAGVSILNNKIQAPGSAGTVDYQAGSGMVIMGAEASTISGNVISSASYNGIQLARCKDVSVTGNTATDAVQPAFQDAQWNAGTITVSGNTFSTHSTAKAAVRLYGFTGNYNPQFTFTGNTVKDSKYGIQIGHEDTGLNDIVNAGYSFSGNTFSNIGTYRLVVYLSAGASPAETAEMDELFVQSYAAGSTAKAITSAAPFTYIAIPNAVWVDDGYTAEACGGHIWGYDAFTAIPAGVNAVAAGGTVNVLAGTYSDGVNVTKSLTFIGANAGIAGSGTRGAESVIDGADVASPRDIAFKVCLPNLTVVVDGFMMTDCAPLDENFEGTAPHTTDITFRNNLVSSCTAIQCGNGGNTCWRNVTVAGNKFMDIDMEIQSSAIVLNSCDFVTVTDNEFRNILFNAVQLGGAANGINITSNRIDTTGAEAIKLGGPIGGGVCSFNTILNANTSRDPDCGGIRIRGVTTSYSVSIENNIISNSFNGVCVKDGESLAGATILVTGNSLAGNSNAGIYNGGIGTLSAEYNWFGSATGPASDLNPGATGDAIKGTGAVDFSPWLGNGTDTDPVAIGFQPNATQLVYIPAKLAFTTPPGGAALGAWLAPQPVVEVRDEFDHPTPWATHAVTLAIGTNPLGGGVLTGTIPLAATAGVASFADVAITVEGGDGYTLVASALNLAPVTSAPFSVGNPLPVLQSLSPIFKTMNSGDFTLTLSGQDFVPHSKVMWGAVEKTPATISANQLTVLISNADIATAGPVSVTVVSPLPAGGTSAAQTFTVTTAPQASEVWVDDDWSGYGNAGGKTWGYDAFATIGTALTGVAQDGIVNVMGGAYAENASTTKRVKVIGALGAGGERLATLTGSLCIDNNGAASNDGLEIKNLIFALAAADTLKLYGVNGGLVENCAFVGNTTGWSSLKAILLDRGASNGNSDVLVKGCVFSGGFFNAIQGYCLRLTVQGCMIADVYEGGINLQGGGGSLVVQNSDITVVPQIATQGYCVRFPSSEAANMTLTGCNLSLTPNNPAEGSYHAAVIVRAGASGDLVVSNCAIQGGIVNLDDTMVNASGNWWGSIDTAVVKTAANGGTLVDYSPWLAVGTDTDNNAVGFKGDFSTLNVGAASPQAGTVGGIQEGVNLATAGGTVNVLSGTYAEHVAIAKAVSVLGADKATTFIDGAGEGVVVLLSTNNVTLKGFTVRNSGTDLNQHAGIAAVGTTAALTGLVIEDNIVTNNATGVALLGARATVRNNAIVDNARYGLVMSYSPYNRALLSTGNTVVGNTLRGNARDGIYCDAACNGNQIAENWIGGADGTHEEGQLTALEGNGIYLWGSSNNVVSCNEIVGNAVYGIEMMMGDGNIITNNVVTNNSAGICVRYGNSPQPFAGNEVHFNDVSGNSTFGISLNFKADFVGNKADYALNAENNWFGHLTGPEHLANLGGTGTATTDYVDFSPWLGLGTDTDLVAIGFQPVLTAVYYLPAGITFSTEPTGALLGEALATQPVITVTNEIGEVATQFNGSIALAIDNVTNQGAPVAGELSGTTTVVVENGVATFSGLAIVKGTCDGYKLIASTEGLPAVTSEAFNIENSTPVLTDVADWSTGEQSAPSTFTAQATDTAADLVKQTLTFSLACTNEATMPEGISFNAATGAFSWQTVESQGGKSYTFLLTVTDDGTGAKSASDTFTVTVNEVNVAPTISIADTTLEVDEQPTQALTFTATATDQDRVPTQALTFSLVAVDGQNYPTGAQIVTTDAGNGTASGAFSWSPTEEQGDKTYIVDVVITDNGVNPVALSATQRVSIAVAEINVVPVLATIPPQSVNFGQTLTFTASATDDDRVPLQTLTFSMTGAPAGAELGESSGVFTWTPTAAQAQENYSFTVKVTDNGSPALSDEQVVTIGAISAAHSCPGYWSPSTNMVVSNTFAFAGTPEGLTWTPVLPNAGWVITAANAGGNGVAEVSNGTAVVFTTLPTVSPAVFTYTVSVPGDQAVSNSLAAAVSFSGLSVDVAPIAIYRYHSADYRRDVSGATAGQFRKIDSSEVNRVLAYWRYGYKPDAAGYDGFAAVAGYAGPEANHHSADTDKNWRISSAELLKVQGYWRGNGYHVDLTSGDGYANDRAGTGPSLLAMRLEFPSAAQKTPTVYNPGETVRVTCTFDPAGTALLALGWKPHLPEGWVIESVSGDANPELANGEIICNAAILPSTACSLVLTVRVPLTETRTVTLGGEALAMADGKNDVESYSMEAVSLAPVDGDSNGMADAWEKAYAGGAGSLDPQADIDGDRLSNYEEYLCGTVPTDALSVLKVESIRALPDGTTQISWASVTGRLYTLQRADGSPAAANFKSIKTGVAADPSGRNVCVDDADHTQSRFYRVLLQD